MLATSGARQAFQGAAYGVMDGVITALGVVAGLSVTDSRLAMLAGVLTVGMAGAFANAAGFHVSEESETHHSRREVWLSTVSAFWATFAVVSLLSIPVAFLSPRMAVLVAGLEGVLFLGFLAFLVDRLNQRPVQKGRIIEYVLVGLSVAALSYGLGWLVKGLGA